MSEDAIAVVLALGTPFEWWPWFGTDVKRAWEGKVDESRYRIIELRDVDVDPLQKDCLFRCSKQMPKHEGCPKLFRTFQEAEVACILHVLTGNWEAPGR